MKYYEIHGGNPLRGEVAISGSKNAALGILPAAIMSEEAVTIRNLPDISDIRVMLEAIESIGATVHFPIPGDRHIVEICGKNVVDTVVDNAYIRKIRASYYLIGAMLGRFKHACVAMPGGCNIGKRPTDLHEKGFKELGAKIFIDEKNFLFHAETSDDPETGKPILRGKEIDLGFPSVGATINVMLAASMAEGLTVISSAAKEPHVVNVAEVLNAMGADIIGAGTDKIMINGKAKFHGADCEVIPDQIEAGTFLCAAAATGGDVTIRHVSSWHLGSILSKLGELGTEICDDGIDGVHITCRGKLSGDGTRIVTETHPGFPTDMQSQFGPCLALAEGESSIEENIFEKRFQYVPELVRMGADAVVLSDHKPPKAVFRGVAQLTGADVTATDLRAGAALVIAGLAARGTTRVHNIEHVLRGYEEFDEKIRQLGGDIRVVEKP